MAENYSVFLPLVTHRDNPQVLETVSLAVRTMDEVMVPAYLLSRIATRQRHHGSTERVSETRGWRPTAAPLFDGSSCVPGLGGGSARVRRTGDLRDAVTLRKLPRALIGGCVPGEFYEVSSARLMMASTSTPLGRVP